MSGSSALERQSGNLFSIDQEIDRLRRDIARYEQQLREFDIDEESTLSGVVADIQRRLAETKADLERLDPGFTKPNANPS